MLAQGHDASVLVTFHESYTIRRYLLGIITGCSNTERLVSSICQYIETRAKYPVDAARRDLLGGGFCDLIRKLGGACGCHAHAAGVLANIDFIIQTIDATILLVYSYGQRYWVSSIMGNLLKFIAQLGGLFGS